MNPSTAFTKVLHRVVSRQHRIRSRHDQSSSFSSPFSSSKSAMTRRMHSTPFEDVLINQPFAWESRIRAAKFSARSCEVRATQSWIDHFPITPSSSFIFPSAYALSLVYSTYLTPTVSKSFSFLSLAHRSRRFILSRVCSRAYSQSRSIVNDPTNTTFFFLLSSFAISSLHNCQNCRPKDVTHRYSIHTFLDQYHFLSALHSAAQ